VTNSEEPLDIIYQDQWLVAINKPAGLLVHRTNIDRHETRFALQILRRQLKQRVYPLHRLDKPTSGVLLFALNPETARSVSEQFRAQQVEKTYLALVRGWTDDAGEIDYPLVDGPIKAAYAEQKNSDKARQAMTRYRTLQRVELPIAVGHYPSSRYSLIEASPTTGRRHQLRRHFKHIFHPIVGDTTYGDSSHNRMFRRQYECNRLLLHAANLEFEHPCNVQHLKLVAPLPLEFQLLLQTIGFSETADIQKSN